IVTIRGLGGHAARPQMAIDPIVIGAHCIIALQSLVSREVNPLSPAVITVGTLHAGTVSNVIPEDAHFEATIRTFDEQTRQLLAERIPQVVRGICETFRATADVEYHLGYPPLVNNAEMAALVKDVALDVVGPERVMDSEPGMGAEDMSYFINAASGAFYRLGVRNEATGKTYGHHHPRFDIDEDALSTGVAMHAAVALRFLNG
ncbi:MAG: amidohydrolase, partial [Thermomicrobia bacterium]|nr:amidohydrolase [Thermomicrobia bacterium]